ncbi:MAG: hypothetical protein GC206_14655 [Alphaproteobacteria bacterium]|nr:hypothetical protein [Alphaproteobacteria bacterium]
MKGIIRVLIIIVVVVLGLGAAGYFFVLPNKYTSTQTFTVERPVDQVYAYLAATPAGEKVGDVTITEVTDVDAQARQIEAVVAFADGETGEATYTVASEGAGSQVTVVFERPIGANPLTRLNAMSKNEVEPVALAASESLNDTLGELTNVPIAGLSYEIVQVGSKPFLYNENCSPIAPAQIKEAVAQSLLVLQPLMRRYTLEQDGPPIAVETSWNEEQNQYCFQIGYAFRGTPPTIYAGGRVGRTPEGRAMRVHYEGTEENVIPTYDQMEALAQIARLDLGKSFEVYFDDPAAAGGSANRDIFYLIENGDPARLAEVAPSAGPVPQSSLVIGPATATEAPAAPPAEGAPATTPPAPAEGEKK